MNKQFQTALIDTLWVLLVSIFGMLVIAITMMHKPTPPSQDAAPANSGTMTVVATWDNSRDDDIDLWVRGPDGRSTGFTQKHGPLFDLLRDDIGKSSDQGQINMENAYSRGAPPGEYVVSLHYYRGFDPVKPEKVHVIVQIRPDPEGSITDIFEGDVVIPRMGLEVMAIRFKLDSSMIVSSKSHIPVCIATQSSGAAVICGGS
jgi:hypothetical protein